MKYEVFLPITPPTATAQHKGERIVRNKFYGKMMVMHYMKRPQRIVHDSYIKLLKDDINTRADGIGSLKLFTSACIVNIDFFFPHPTSTKKSDQKKVFPRIARPDVDNMAKGLLDCLTEVGLLQDDCHIFDLRLRKFNVPATKQGISITISDDLEEYIDGAKE